MPEFICPEELSRNDYLDLLKYNDSYIFIKFEFLNNMIKEPKIFKD